MELFQKIKQGDKMTTKMGTGLKRAEDENESASMVAKKAVEEAKQKLDGREVNLAIVYSSSKYDYQEVVNAVREATNNAPLIGCSTGGEFTEDGVGMGNIGVALISSDDMEFFIGLAEGLKEDAERAINDLGSQLPTRVEGYPHLFGILLIDGLAGRGEEATLLASTVFDQVTFVGGAAGDDLQMKETYVFANDRVATNAACMCLIASKYPMYTSVQHGHIPLSEPLKVTKSRENVVYEVDGRPAWDVWKEKTAEDARGMGIDVEELTEPSEIGSFCVCYELGLATGGGQYKIRFPLSKNDDGSLNFACGIPEGATFRIMKSPKEKQIDAARKAAELAKRDAGDTKLAGILVFDCVVRAMILGDDFPVAVEQFKEVFRDVPLLGWETYGEICMAPGQFSGFHNTTSVVLAIPAGE